ncbi:MAG: D-amino-acid transaminase [Gammaproteobacteria bacterium]|nr:D-amino-acid transaminase [Gammaproteobacteria bacterium]MBU1722262.1 D-amino-acid transaminase [Gammaproteobacteria bacterium]MBU2005369.1 D-amino-acid transaminase [Gammaproteobacteria bacterium]
MNNNSCVYLNGEYLPAAEAKLSIFDRGFLFADGVYEVTSVLDGKMIDNPAHLIRLQRSLAELGMKLPVTPLQLVEIQREVIRRNGLQEGILYLQVTRGMVPERSFAIPQDATPSLILFTQTAALRNNPLAERGICVISVDDIRWQRRDIKTTMLLPASLAKQQAINAGADDAWLVENGYVTEGTANNAFIITQDGKIVTRHLGNDILHGITRAAVLKLANEQSLMLEERSFTLAEAYVAAEAFSTGASAFVLPVVSIDGHVLGNGKPGSLTRRLRELYLQTALLLAE